MSIARSVTPANNGSMDANKDGGTGIEATFPDILLDDSTKLVSFSGTKFP